MGIGGHRMPEVEKMYRNAHVYPKIYGDITKETFENKVFNMADMCNESFTAEKQLSLIKWLLDNKNIGFLKFEVINGKYEVYDTYYECDKYRESLDEALADYICCLWQDLTDQERTQIAEILRG